MARPSELLLLADHIKLSLLERQRAKSLDLASNTQDAEISTSLDSLRDGLEQLEAQTAPDAATPKLRAQYNDLHLQFHGTAAAPPSSTLTQPNDASLSADFSRATSTTPRTSLKRTPSSGLNSKSVRFSDNPLAPTSAISDAEDRANRAALFPYRDDPSSQSQAQGYSDDAPDHGALDNQQIHEYHARVMAEQDGQLDALGASVGRQRELSIQIGDELDVQSEMLDDVDRGVTRHQSQIDRARDRVGKVARKAKDNWTITVIACLIIILVLLLVILK